MSGKNRNRFESPLGVWANPVSKTSWASLPAKQAITVGSSLGFVLTWSCYMIGGYNFDLPKLMPVEHISLMSSWCLSLTNTRQDTRQYVTHQPIKNLRTSNEQKARGSYSRRPLLSLPNPPPFSFPPYPLPVSTPATQASLTKLNKRPRRLFEHLR